MKRYEIQIRNVVKKDIEQIKDFIVEKNKMLSYFDGIQTKQIGWSDSREIGLTVRYKFNTTRSKYKGTGAGNEEKNRL